MEIDPAQSRKLELVSRHRMADVVSLRELDGGRLLATVRKR
ncbi:hypothetical protein [Fundidesulfovibrio magnetotacticus]|nr:hypothetical protein [Fundidesulfovibrio magnetotacticus]